MFVFYVTMQGKMIGITKCLITINMDKKYILAAH